ncbi:hypothetical protein [Geobacillus sp. WSUCF1]|uniref:hypothetical protein n=1 Tax=Geobacillus sp. WSUCF1 TaxID=886559 RepID=UPI000426B4D1|nr:hypothetical protein [Geobacillus sp. WSUCF1]
MKAASAGKLFVVMAVCTVYFLSFVRLGVLAYESFGLIKGVIVPGRLLDPSLFPE